MAQQEAVHRSDDPAPEANQRGVTVRSVIIGVATALFIQGWGIYSRRLIRSSSMTSAFLSPALFVAVLIVLFVLNPVIKAIKRSGGLNPREVLTILAVGLVGGAPVAPLLAFITIPYYFATPENQWEKLLHPYLPSWVAPLDVDGAVTLLFNGTPEGGAVPWGAWMVPMFWWLLLCSASPVIPAGVCVWNPWC